MQVFKKIILSFILIAELLFVSSSLAAEKITIGILAFRPKPIVEAKWQPLINYLNQKVDNTEFEFNALNYTELEEAIAHKHIDFVFTNSSHFVQLAHKTKLSSPLATLINKKEGNQFEILQEQSLLKTVTLLLRICQTWQVKQSPRLQ
jgi:ABC-type phosphate/phosphonate transport system substrate-binding protein